LSCHCEPEEFSNKANAVRIGLQPGRPSGRSRLEDGARGVVGGHLPVELLELVGTAGGYFDGLLLKRALLAHV
jgi:hypothetical protein